MSPALPPPPRIPLDLIAGEEMEKCYVMLTEHLNSFLVFIIVPCNSSDFFVFPSLPEVEQLFGHYSFPS